ncbi:MAG TPA: hypothetical protein VE545_00220 [Candidatus Dormibacteraeota bacterium]|nr:hypothetical protein [Candidatus Dormibacteraeota bacterium]
MLMKSGERWHCVNAHCPSEVLVESDSGTAGASPRCVCGAAMKRNYIPPVFKYLDFLRMEESEAAPQRIGEK